MMVSLSFFVTQLDSREDKLNTNLLPAGSIEIGKLIWKQNLQLHRILENYDCHNVFFQKWTKSLMF